MRPWVQGRETQTLGGHVRAPAVVNIKSPRAGDLFHGVARQAGLRD